MLRCLFDKTLSNSFCHLEHSRKFNKNISTALDMTSSLLTNLYPNRAKVTELNRFGSQEEESNSVDAAVQYH